MSEIQTPAGTPGTKRPGLNAEVIKLVAIIAMTIDHATIAFAPEYYGFPGALLHFVGRITGPVMFFFVAEGYHHTRNKNQYTLRMGIFAAVAYVPYIYFRYDALPGPDNWWQFNVIYTLFLGLLALRALHAVSNVPLRWMLILACFLLSGLGDWAFSGVLVILIFDLFRGRFKYRAMVYGIFVVVRTLPALASVMTGLFSGTGDVGVALAQVFVSCGMFLPLLLLRFYSGARGRGSKWLFYIYYPGHLLVLALLKQVLL